jgi:hypothetical protein
MDWLYVRHAVLSGQVRRLNERAGRIVEKATRDVGPHEKSIAANLFLRKPLSEVGEADRYRPTPRFLKLAVHYLAAEPDSGLRDSQERVVGILFRHVKRHLPTLRLSTPGERRKDPLVRAVRRVADGLSTEGYAFNPATLYGIGLALLNMGHTSAAAPLLVAAAHQSRDTAPHVQTHFAKPRFNNANAARFRLPSKGGRTGSGNLSFSDPPMA